MHSTSSMRVRIGLALIGTGLLSPVLPAAAQVASASQESPADALSRNLRALSQNPKSVSALMGAGMAALQVGDPQASLTFFARAEEQLPRDGRIKMWMGSALVQLEQPQAAMKFFNEASELGVSESDIAKDRGLAWDIMGDQRRAQRDYQLALRRGADPETTRRLALSFGISGDRERALQLLEDQLLVQDRAAMRTRALVLALTGDAAGADRAAEQSLPPGQASVMAPFLARLPGLSPSDRALAVHLGHFPTPGGTRPAAPPPQTYAANPQRPPGNQLASVDAATRAGAPDRSQNALGSRPAPAQPNQNVTRRRPGAEERVGPSTGRSLSGFSIASPGAVTAQPSSPPRNPPPAPAQRAPVQRPPVQVAEARPVPSPPVQSQPEPGFDTLAQNPPAVVPAPAPEPSKPVSRPPARQKPARTEASPAGRGRVADLASVLEGLDETAPASTARSGARGNTRLAARDAARDPKPAEPRDTDRNAKGKGKTDAKTDGKTQSARDKDRSGRTAAADEAGSGGKRKKGAQPAREPSRVWVQVAGGANKGTLPRAYSQVKSKAPKLLGGRGAWTVPNRATNRILVGPFASSDEAQDFVNKLGKSDVSAFTFTSDSGQKVEKLPPK